MIIYLFRLVKEVSNFPRVKKEKTKTKIKTAMAKSGDGRHYYTGLQGSQMAEENSSNTLMFLEILASRVDGCLNPEPDQGVLTSDEPRWGTTTAGLAISGFCRGGERRGGGGVGKLSGPGSGWDLGRKDESRKPSLVEVG